MRDQFNRVIQRFICVFDEGLEAIFQCLRGLGGEVGVIGISNLIKEDKENTEYC